MRGCVLARVVLGVLLVMATLSSLALAAESPVTRITFWTTEVSADRQAVINYLADVFEIRNPDVVVDIVGVDENSIAQRLQQAAEQNTLPDIVGCASDLVVAFNDNGWISTERTSRVLESVGLGRFYAGALSKLRCTAASACGIPFNGWVQGIWYRKDLFDEYDLPPPDTWPRILNAAKTLHNPSNGTYGILIGTRDDAYAEQVFTHLALSAGVREFASDGRVLFDSKATVDTLEFYRELAKYTPPGPQWWRGRDFYLQGRLAMMFYSTFIMDDLAIQAIAENSLTAANFKELSGADFDPRLGDNTGMVSVITGTRKASYGVIHALGLLKTDDPGRANAADRFVRFLFNDDAYVTWLHMVPGGMLPVLKDIGALGMFYRDAQGVFQHYSRQRIESIVSGFETLKGFSLVNGTLVSQAAQASARGVISKMIVSVLDGGVAPQAAVAEAAQVLREITRDQ